MSLSDIVKYASLATQAVHEVQDQMPDAPGGHKKAVAIAAVLAGAHAAEEVDDAKVQQIGQYVELAVSLAKLTGLFTSKSPVKAVQVPEVPAPK